MEIRRGEVVKTALVLSLSAALGFCQGQTPGAIPFAPGETLTYEIEWAVFPAGTVVATLRRTGDGPTDDYEVDTTARSQSFSSLLYNVQDEFRSYFNPQTMCSQHIFKEVNEGSRHLRTDIVFDAGRRLAILNEQYPTKPKLPPKHAENAIPPCVEDIVTAFYYVRRQTFQVGKPIRLSINDGAKTYEVTAEVQAREQIHTLMGSRWAFRVEPTVFRGLYKRKGRMLVWFSDDPQRLPLRIKVMISIGTITGELRSVTTTPPSARPAARQPSAPAAPTPTQP